MDVEEQNNNIRNMRKERESEQDGKRERVISQLHIIAKSKKDFSEVLNDTLTILSLSTVKIDIEQIRSICKTYNDTKPDAQGLDNANKLFQELDHCNNGIVELSHDSVGLKYI